MVTNGGDLNGADLPLLARHLAGFYAVALLDLGRRTGALAAVLDGATTAAEVADRAGLDERNAAEWLAGMAAAGYLVHEAGHFRLSASGSATFEGGLAVDPDVVLEFTRRLPQLYPDVASAMRTGGGVPSHRYNEVAGDLLDRFNAPVYDALLIHDWLAALPELRDALEEGIEVAELGCGTGHGCRLVGQAFPRSRVTGFDIDGSWFDQGRKEIAEAGLSNVDLVEADVVSLPEGRQYDLVLVLDALHHFGDPQAALREVSRVLRRGGRVLVVEPTMTGDLEADLAAPGAVSTFAGSILYCMQDALAAGGPGYGAGVPASEMSRLFESAGLTPTDARPGHSGYTVYLARRPR